MLIELRHIVPKTSHVSEKWVFRAAMDDLLDMLLINPT